MGTSRNDPSPRTPPWKPIREFLGNPKVSLEIQSREIWKAALSDRDGRLIEDLTIASLAKSAEIAEKVQSPIQASKSFDHIVNELGGSFFTDIAKRALLRAVVTGQGANGFGSEFFAETASYYVSRDLAGVIGNRDKIKTSSDGIEFKSKLRDVAKITASKVAKSLNAKGEFLENSNNWRVFVTNTINELKGNKP
jgi:hypothetical protein